MNNILEDLRKVERLRGDTYSSAEVLGMVGRAAAEIDRLRAALKPFADAMTVAERDLPHDQHERLTYCREQLTLYEFHNARCAHQQGRNTEKSNG